MNFFNPGVKYDAQNPQAFDAHATAREIQQRRMLAEMLGKPLDEGKMVSGWYVAPNKNASIANALQQMLGGYMNGANVNAERDLDKASRESENDAWKKLRTAGDDETSLVAQLELIKNDPSIYTHRDPSQVGPQLPAPAQAAPEQPVPVPQAPPVQPTPAQIQSPLGRASQVKHGGAGRGFVNPPMAGQPQPAPSQAELGAALDAARSEKAAAYANLYGQGKWGSIQKSKDPAGFEAAKNAFNMADAKVNALQKQWAASITPDQLSGKAEVPVAPLARAKAAQPAAPVIPPAQMPMARAQAVQPVQPAQPMPPQVPVAPQPQAQEPTFNVDTRLQQQQYNEASQGLARAKQAREEAAMAQLDASGARGRQYADAMRAAQFKGESKTEFGKPGEYIVRNGQVVGQLPGGGSKEYAATVNTPDGQMVIYKDGSREMIGGVRSENQVKTQNDDRARTETQQSALRQAKILNSEIDSVLESKMPEDATGFFGTAGSMLNKATGGLVKTDGSNARAYVDGLGDKMIQAAIQNLAARGISPSQLANTETEAKRLMGSMLNMDYSRMDANQVREQLKKARAMVTQMFDDASSKLGASESPSTLNGIPAYQRGQTIRPQ